MKSIWSRSKTLLSCEFPQRRGHVNHMDFMILRATRLLRTSFVLRAVITSIGLTLIYIWQRSAPTKILKKMRKVLINNKKNKSLLGVCTRAIRIGFTTRTLLMKILTRFLKGNLRRRFGKLSNRITKQI